jgi:NAD(P)-dependent dehydrogenase (short-subunit alcohol dehydrogenase family)
MTSTPLTEEAGTRAASVPPDNLAGRTAIVTGAGRGLGRAYAIDLARRGAATVVNDLDADVADEVVKEIEAVGGTAVACVASVATPEGGQAIVQTALREFGAVDAVVNNAGQILPAYFEDVGPGKLDPILDTHLRGAFFVTRPAWTVMKEQGYGRVIMTSSPTGMFGHHAMTNYAAAKAGLYGLTKALAYEGAAHGINVNAILPNARTSIQQTPIPDFRDVLLETVGRERLRKRDFTQAPELVASLVSHLVSPDCAISGEAFSVMAGRIARVFIGVSAGWYPPDPDTVTAETIAEHIDAIRALDEYSVPGDIFDEIIGAIDGIPEP